MQATRDKLSPSIGVKKGTTETIVITKAANTAIVVANFPFSLPIIILKPAFLYSSSNTQEIAIKCGNCQQNCIANRIPAAKPKSLVAATHPSRTGIAPGKAPIKTEIADTLFKGVYTST